MKLRTMYLVAPEASQQPDGSSILSRKLTVHDSHESAIEECNRVLGQGTCSYQGMVIYKAISLVRRTAPPIKIQYINDAGEVE